jgi:hypothetical protein
MPSVSGRTARCLASLSLAAALGGCADDEPAPQPSDVRPDTYVPASRPQLEEIECTRPDAGDAGDRKPELSDPTTLVLRLDDLPDGFSYDVEYQEGGVLRMLLTEVGDDLEATLERAGVDTAAIGRFGRGRLPPPPQPPGAPPAPPSCPSPKTEVRVAAAVASSPDGAATLYRVRELLAGTTVAFGEGRADAVTRRSEPPGAVGEERELLVRHYVRGIKHHTVIWRQGRVVAIVSVVTRDSDAARALLARLLPRQAGYIRAAR